MARSSWRWNNDRSKQTVSDGPTLFPESLWTVKAIVSRNCWIIEESWSRDIEHCQTKFNKPCKRFFKYSWNDLFSDSGLFWFVFVCDFFLVLFLRLYKVCVWLSKCLNFSKMEQFWKSLKIFFIFRIERSRNFSFFLYIEFLYLEGKFGV